MRIALAAAIAALALSFSPAVVKADTVSEFSSQITIGPGGVRIGRDHRRSDSRAADRCRRLRRECEVGPRGTGACRRYRAICR